jgi:hypothetical protein
MRFIGEFEQLLIEGFGRLEVVPEGLFDDHPAPVVVVLLHQSSGGELLHDGPEETGSGCQVVKEVVMSGVIAVDFREAILKLGIQLIVAEIASRVIKAA